MSRVSFSGARTGRRAPNKGGMLKSLEWKMGERKRLILPLVDGALVLFAKPYHPVMNQSLELVKTSGSGTYSISKVRCMHVYAQTSAEESLKIAEKGEVCLFCDVAKYEKRRQWEDINEEFGQDGFKEMTKEEQREYFKKSEKDQTVDASYYQETDADGNKESRTQMDIYLLALDIKLDKKNKPVLDENGEAQYEPILMPASKSRLGKFKNGVDNAVASGSIDEDMLYPFIENEGTDVEEEVLIGFVDFLVSFPMEADKMTSGRNMSAQPVSESMSVISPELITGFEAKAAETVKQAEQVINSFYVNLKAHTREEAMDMFKAGEDYVNGLIEDYRTLEDTVSEDGREIMSDENRDAEIFAKIIKAIKKTDAGTDDETVEEEAPKKEKTRRERPAEVDVEEGDDEPAPRRDKPARERRDKPERTKPAEDATDEAPAVVKPKKKKPKVDVPLDEDAMDDSIFDMDNDEV